MARSICGLLDEFSDGEIKRPDWAQQFRDHLPDCPNCQARLEGRMHEHMAANAPVMHQKLKVTIEGLTGSGKSCLARYIHDAIEDFIPGVVLHLEDDDAQELSSPTSIVRLQAVAHIPGLEITIGSSSREVIDLKLDNGVIHRIIYSHHKPCHGPYPCACQPIRTDSHIFPRTKGIDPRLEATKIVIADKATIDNLLYIRRSIANTVARGQELNNSAELLGTLDQLLTAFGVQPE